MKDIAGDAVRATQIGGRGAMHPDSNTADALIIFQSVALDADRLSKLGVIAIHDKHRESMTTNRYIDRITFTRLR